MKKSNSKDDIKAFKSCRIEHKKLLKTARNDYYLEFLEPKLDTNSKYLFNFIKRLRRDSVGIEAIKLNGNLTTNPSDKAEALAQQYQSVFVEEDTSNIPNILHSIYPDMKDFTISQEGVLKQLMGLNVNKSVGPDGLSCWFTQLLSRKVAGFN